MNKHEITEKPVHQQNKSNTFVPSQEVRQIVTQVISEFSGPIPPPNIVKQYENILPGSADRILSMAEEQQKHRHEQERNEIHTESRDSLLGILFAFLMSLACLGLAALCVVKIPNVAGAIAGGFLGTSSMISIILAMIYSTRSSDHREKMDSQEHESDS